MTKKAAPRSQPTRLAAHHWRDGWYFSRFADGSVEIMRALTQHDRKAKGPEAKALVRIHVPASEWDSIVREVGTAAVNS